MNKLKEKWGVSSNIQLTIIFIVFAITGSSSAILSKPFTNLVGISKENFGYFFLPIRLIIIFPIYQVLLVIIGTVFGQFSFFWNFEKKMLYRMKLKPVADFFDKVFNTN
jgi:manganese efflux pump family protein